MIRRTDFGTLKLSPTFRVTLLRSLPFLALMLSLSVTSSAQSQSIDYSITTIADTSGTAFGGQSFTYINSFLGINNGGVIAFAATSATPGYSGLFTTSGDIIGAPLITALTPGFASASRLFSGASISDPPNQNVVSVDRASGSPPVWLLREWSSPDTFTLAGESPSSFQSATQYVDINDNLNMTFLGVDASSNEGLYFSPSGGPVTELEIYSIGTLVRPQISNDNNIVVSANGVVKIFSVTGTTLSAVTAITTTTSYSSVGNYPGISSDGNVIAFYGQQAGGTTGIYIYNRYTNGVLAPLTPPPPAPGIFPVEQLVSGANSDNFTDFSPSLNNRVGVVSVGGDDTSGGAYGTQLVTLIFNAKRNGNLGIYTVDLLFVGGKLYSVASPRVVAEVGTTNPTTNPSLPDFSTVTSFTLYKPIAYNPTTRDTYITLTATFSSGLTGLYSSKRLCQVPNASNFDFKQVDSAWENEPNARHLLGDPPINGHAPIIQYFGCATTSSTNLLNYYGVTTSSAAGDVDYAVQSPLTPVPDSDPTTYGPATVDLSNGTGLTPLINNTLFKTNVFSTNSDVDFAELPDFANARGVSVYPLAKTYIDWPARTDSAYASDVAIIAGSGGNVNLDKIVDFYICNGQPVVLKVENTSTGSPIDDRHNHFVLATGRVDPITSGLQVTTYTINDPANAINPNKNLMDTESGRNYQGTYRGIRGVSQKGFNEKVSFIAQSPVELLVVDSFGRTVGFDPNTSTTYTGIYNSSYATDNITSLDGDIDGDVYKTIIIGTAKNVDGSITGDGNGVDPDGNYTLQAIGTGSGTYRLTISGTDTAGNLLQNTVVGETSAGQVDSFAVAFGAGQTATPSITNTAGKALISVPHVVGETQVNADGSILSAGLTVGTTTNQSNAAPAGTVISQFPYGGDNALSGTIVNLTVSSGPATVAVPNVVGLTQTSATSAITAAGLVVGTVTTATSSTVPAGSVISEGPAAGTTVVVGSAVNLVVSSTIFPLTVTDPGTGTGTVTSSPAGINCGATCTANFASGTVVTLMESPGSGSTFAGWSGSCTGTGACSVTLSAAASVTATFNTFSGNVLSFSPASINFGTVDFNRRKKEVLTLENNGTAEVLIGEVSFTNVSGVPTDFEFHRYCRSGLRPGESCTIAVFFYATALGTDTAILQVATSSTGSPLQVPITAMAIK
jgi:hypothetical protein